MSHHNKLIFVHENCFNCFIPGTKRPAIFQIYKDQQSKYKYYIIN